jgi:peptide-methionine (R)-S-oxide reductase
MYHSSKPHRRLFLKLLSTGIPAAFALRASSAASIGKKTVRIVEFDASGIRTGVVDVEKVEKSEADWKKQLTPQQFQIARQAGTERPGTGKYAYNQADGLYSCICCGTVLFDSKTKFESGTGWPSFGSRLPRRTYVRNATPHLAWYAMKSYGRVATPILDTFLTTARLPRTCDTA